MPSIMSPIPNSILTKSSYHIFTLRADAELAAPDADARGDVILCITTTMAAPRAFIKMIGNPRDWPYLSTMGMAT